MGSHSGLLSRASATVNEWTPLALLVAYCVFSFFIYVVLPPLAHEIIWYIFAALQTLTSISVSTEAMQSVRPSVLARRQMREVRKNGWKLEPGQDWPHIDVIIVAYLPNEVDIIMKQIRYALTKIDYPEDKLTVNVVYNTPKPMEIEGELEALEDEYDNIRIVKVHHSSSKAENINYFLSLPDCKGEIITIYDTDHYADPSALRWVAKRFLSGEVDIIQGRCCVYNYHDSAVTRMVAAEFDMIYGVMHLGRAHLHGYGFFGE